MAEEDIKVVGLANSKSKGKTNWKITGAIIGIIVLALGIIAGIVLVRQNQDIREKASTTSNMCPAAESCPYPGEPSRLWSCSPQEADGTVDEIICDTAGRIGVCGNREYCCPAPGGAWTTNLTSCSVALATTTATATATSTASSTAIATATSTSTTSSSPTATSTSSSTSSVKATATSTSSSTPFPVPETGSDIPTIIGAGFGIIMILVSLGLAL